MSRAFIREVDGDDDTVPDLPVSEYPNYVTTDGLAQLRERLDETQARLAAIDPDAESSRWDRAHVQREQRWLQSRILAAIPVSEPTDPRRIGFGAVVALVDQHGATYRYRIVGEDEADPEQGRVSWVSPLARNLNEARVGDSVTWKRPAGDLEVEVVAIDWISPEPAQHDPHATHFGHTHVG